jgi:glutathione S-transferase
MRLYSSSMSPFAARCRLVIHLKGIAAEIVDLPGSPKPPELYALNPIGKVPTLEHDGLVIPESEVICEYLDEIHPLPPLLPPEPAKRAQLRALARIADLYLMTQVFALFPYLSLGDADGGSVRAIFERIDRALGQLDHFLPGDAWAVGDSLTLADCALIPHLGFVGLLLPYFAEHAVSTDPPKIAAYRSGMRRDPQAARVLDEMETAYRAFEQRLLARRAKEAV